MMLLCRDGRLSCAFVASCTDDWRAIAYGNQPTSLVGSLRRGPRWNDVRGRKLVSHESRGSEHTFQVAV